MSRGNPTKATLVDDAGTLTCQFNPETLHRSKTASYSDVAAQGAQQQPTQQFVGTGPETLSVTLLFDAFDPSGNPPGTALDPLIERIFGWLQVPAQKQTAANPRPTGVTFSWGTGLRFIGAVQSVTVDYLMFAENGATLRANVALSMQSVPDVVPAQNPTSGGQPGRAAILVIEGDTLASVAYRHYGDPALWRAVAAANAVSDPARVPVGTRLLLPARGQAVAMSSVTDG